MGCLHCNRKLRISGKRKQKCYKTFKQHLEMFKEKIPNPGTENELNRRLEAKRVEFLNHLKTQNELKEQAIALKNKIRGIAARTRPVENGSR